MTTSHTRPRPTSNLPVIANFDSAHLTIGAGVAIFHLATSRVVVCYHSKEKYWFLPKGRRDAGEDSGMGAEREGFEEVRISFTMIHQLTDIDAVRLQKPFTSHPTPASPTPSPQFGCCCFFICERTHLDAADACNAVNTIHAVLVHCRNPASGD